MLKDYLNNLKRVKFGAEQLTYSIVSAGSWQPKPNASANAVFVKDSPQLQICNLMFQMTLSYRPPKNMTTLQPPKTFQIPQSGKEQSGLTLPGLRRSARVRMPIQFTSVSIHHLARSDTLYHPSIDVASCHRLVSPLTALMRYEVTSWRWFS